MKTFQDGLVMDRTLLDELKIDKNFRRWTKNGGKTILKKPL